MKDIQKIKEFFSKPLNEGNEEYFKPVFRKDKSYPDFLYIDIAYPAGSDVLSVGGSKTMGGQDRESGAAKALTMGNNIAKKLEARYKIDSDDIEVKDLKNGKVQVFAISDKFIKMASPSLDEAEEEETAVDMAKKQLDALGIKYEMSGNKFKPFKAIYKPSNEDLDALYDQEYELTRIYQNDKSEENWKKLSQIREKGKQLEKFDEIIYLFNLGSAVKSSMNEANGFKSGKEFINIKLQKYPKAVAKINQLINMVGESNFTMEMAEWIFDFFNNASYESPVNEAQEEDVVDTITMDVPLFIRMLEYSREDAAEDMDLHDVTEKANILGKEKGVLSMEDYDAIVGAAEEIEEGFYGRGDKRRGLQNQSKLSSAEYQMAKKLKSFKASDWKWNTDEDLYIKVVEESMGGQLDEPYFIEVSVRDARKALDLFQDRYRKSNIEMYGSNVYAANTPEDIYDLYYDLTSQDIEVLDYNVDGDLDEATDYMKRRKAMDDYAVSKKDKPAKSYNPTPSGKTDYMKRREKELAETILAKLKK